jgi:hypothetical protein
MISMTLKKDALFRRLSEGAGDINAGMWIPRRESNQQDIGHSDSMSGRNLGGTHPHLTP